MTPEQLRAFRHATASEGLALIDGQAGTGKSYTDQGNASGCGWPSSYQSQRKIRIVDLRASETLPKSLRLWLQRYVTELTYLLFLKMMAEPELGARQ